MNPSALFKISYGLYIVSSVDGSRLNGQIANAAKQVTADPAQVAIALNKDNLTHEFVKKSGVFTASILSQEAPMSLIGRFGFKSGRDLEKFEGVEYKIGQSGAPIVLEDTVAYFEARVTGSLDVGTHTIFVGTIVDAEILNDHEPMTYAYYHQIKGGRSPKNAPTYQKPVSPQEEAGVKQYKCKICGYVYDPKKGDPQAQIAPGTCFSDLPESWVCPICSAPKSQFEATA